MIGSPMKAAILSAPIRSIAASRSATSASTSPFSGSPAFGRRRYSKPSGIGPKPSRSGGMPVAASEAPAPEPW
jgi:hypothetical protein